MRQCKPKNCRVCKNTFQPMNSLQYACSPKCALTATREKEALRVARELKIAERQRKGALRARREALKSRSQWIKETQAVFNKWVRLRDEKAGLPCISCGTFNPKHTGKGGAWDAGHFLSRGAFPELRFEPTNCWRQCKKCNNFRSGNFTNYRKSLLLLIGEDKVATLEGPHPPKKYTIDDLKQIKSDYKKKIKELESAGI